MVKMLLCYKADPGAKTSQGQSIITLFQQSINARTNLEIDRVMRMQHAVLKMQRLVSLNWTVMFKRANAQRKGRPGSLIVDKKSEESTGGGEDKTPKRTGWTKS